MVTANWGRLGSQPIRRIPCIRLREKSTTKSNTSGAQSHAEGNRRRGCDRRRRNNERAARATDTNETRESRWYYLFVVSGAGAVKYTGAIITGGLMEATREAGGA